MNKTGLFSLIFTILFVFNVKSQKKVASILNIDANLSATSNIIQLNDNDTSYTKVVLKGAMYLPLKNNLPYFSITQSSNQPLDLKISDIVTVKVAEPTASIIKKHFGNYLTSEFELINVSGISSGKIINHFQLIPFKINNLNQVEELVSYKTNWVENLNSKLNAKSTSTFVSNSVLSTGNWYKIGVGKTGVYKIDKSLLTKMGIDVSSLDPKKIKIYGNGGNALPELNSATVLDDLKENAIKVVGESDGVFNDNDYILFYAKGSQQLTYNATSRLKYNLNNNIYSDSSFYFLNFENTNGLRIGASNTPSNIVNNTNSYDYVAIEEKNDINFIKSGREFYGQFFDITNTYNFTWNDGNFVLNDSLIASVTMAGRAYTPNFYSFNVNGISQSFTISQVGTYYLDPYANVINTVAGGANSNINSINLSVTKLSSSALAWLDKITINARRQLSITNKQFNFRDARVTGTLSTNAITYNLQNTNSEFVTIWNVSDFTQPIEVVNTNSNSSISFNYGQNNTPDEFVAMVDEDYYKPVYVSKVSNQNIHAQAPAEYLIITHPLFVSQAQRLANLHQTNENLTYQITTTEEIYNEFSSGNQDISAIRNYIKMLYTKGVNSGTNTPKFVVLLGDGSYKLKNRDINTNSCLIPSYQSINSTAPLASVTTDDFYGLMDANEGEYADGSLGSNTYKVDIGVGRLMARTVTEMNQMINKIENYYAKDDINNILAQQSNCGNTSEGTYGDWRTWVSFIADDGDKALHMNQSNKLANVLKASNPEYNQEKIYLDSYQSVSTPGGIRYPDAVSELERRMKKGALVINYTGHGGELGLTEERIVDVNSINNWSNFNKLPLMITATCEFSRFDDPERTSAGEYVMLNPKGGAVSLFTTVRVAFAETNEYLNNILFKYLFSTNLQGNKLTIGEVLKNTKADIGQATVYANFHLLGDPAVVLRYPKQKIVTTQINSDTAKLVLKDTLGALKKVILKGKIALKDSSLINTFNGIVYVTVFDKEQNISCLINQPYSATNYGSAAPTDPLIPFTFNSFKNIIYKGKSIVKNGEYSCTFIIPKDVSFVPGNAKISYYATDGIVDASGYYTNIVVGGKMANDAITDTDGPNSKLFINDIGFVEGGTTNEKPVFYANITDSSGINTIGTGIGHDIVAILDNSENNPLILNDFYEANINSYQSGQVKYQFNNLSEGNHRIKFKAWDIQNNSSESYIDFVVANSDELVLKHVLNYPNPFTTNTKFSFEHNQACTPLKVTIQIFTISGKLAKTIQTYVYCEGYRPGGIVWDGKDDYGDKLAKGVYIYKLSIQTNDNKNAEKLEKLVILN
ncbi:MAG: type IX secretion system sortase PorU [Bacteroidetes bacterium]|nr:type IX secretion system sortase PorU [Bacteroidota bacterium]